MFKIVDFKPEHVDQIEMREHEAGLEICGKVIQHKSRVAKTVYLGERIITMFGIMHDDGLWQIPSKHLESIATPYARKTIKVTKELIRNCENAYTVCLPDKFHERWMKFLGFVPVKTVYDKGKEYIRYEVA